MWKFKGKNSTMRFFREYHFHSIDEDEKQERYMCDVCAILAYALNLLTDCYYHSSNNIINLD